MKQIDGKAIANEVLETIKNKIDKPVGLAFVLVGDDAPSQTYVAMKQKACESVGMTSHVLKLEASITSEALLNQIEALNQDPQIHGILVQQPLPKHLDLYSIVSAISPQKDVDGFHPINLGKLMMNDTSGFIPCTPLGIVTLLQKSKIEISSKNVVVVGRSNIVGKPLATLLTHQNATVTLAHSKTKNLPRVTSQADILICATGHHHLITPEYIQEGAIVIDVGINRINGSIEGDVDFEAVAKKAGAITPVPGGVGPMTIAMLLQNTLKAAS